MRAVALLALCLWGCEPPPDDRIYRYVDDRGHESYVTGLGAVPAEYKESAEPVSVAPNRGGPATAAGPGAVPEVADDTVVYRFPGPGGRPSFTNRRDLVPEAARASVKVVDLSHVSTNPELGRDLDAAVDHEIERLSGSAPCREARANVRLGRLGLLWRNERHLVVIAGIIAAFLFVTPFAVRKLGAPWLRVLAFAIPVLLLTGILTHALIVVNRTMSGGARLSELCDPVTKEPAAADAAAKVRLRVDHADQLRTAVEAAIAGPQDRIREEMAH